MKKWIAGGFIAASLTLVAGTAHADSVVTLKPGDFDSALRDVRSAGHEGFLDPDGLAIWTDDNSSQAKVAEYWDVASQNLPDSVSMGWSGTDPQPGTQIVFDFDQTPGNGNDFNILVGEPVYGNDFWLTGGSSADAHGVCPETGGGFGSDCHGTLSEWKQAISNADVKAYGFSLGSGIKGSGVIHSVNVDGTQYRFSGTPDTPTQPTPTDTTGTVTASKKVHPHRVVVHVHLSTAKLSAGQSQGMPLTWKVTKDGKRVYKSTMGAGQKASFPVKFRHHTGRHTVQVLANGGVVKTVTVRTGR